MTNNLWKRLLVTGSFVCLLRLCGSAQGAEAIVHTRAPEGWLIRTRSSVYQLSVTADGRIMPVYYGSRELGGFEKRNARWSGGVDEIPTRGGFPFHTPALEVVFSDGVRSLDLKYEKGKVVSIAGRPTLEITCRDRHYPFEVTSYIRDMQDFDILEKWMVVRNLDTDSEVVVENALSGSIALPQDAYTLTQLSGKQLSEFQPFESLLTPGLKVIENKTFKSSFNAPWFAVRPRASDGKTGPVWFGSVHYSGNWRLAFDQTFQGGLQILGGINFWDTRLTLKPGESFRTPVFTLGYSDRGLEGAQQELSAYVRNEVLPATHRHMLRPVLFNGYYANGLDVNENQQIELAKAAARMGVEVFVMDDGWFKGRKDPNSGLGDWVVDSVKFPHGLTALIREVNKLGMKFGIWVEPENLDMNSDLYRAHPDWVLRDSTRPNASKRKMLNLAKPEVFDYLQTALSRLLKENHIAYVKWDQNNFLSEVGWPDAPLSEQRAMRIDFIHNLYRLVDTLKTQFPDVWFESCSSGGGRVDLGMMSRMDLAWISDNTYALNRLFIQYGYLSAMPANTMISFVVDKIGSLYRQPTSLDFRFDVAMAGVLGISDDILHWPDSSLSLAGKKIALYKQIRPLIQQGTLYRLVSPFTTNREALQYVSRDSTSAVLMAYNMGTYLPGSQFETRGSEVIRFQGLKPDARYQVRQADKPEDKGVIYPGSLLMEVGIPWPLEKAYTSTILQITTVPQRKESR